MRALFLAVSLLCTSCVLFSGYLFPLYCGDGFVTEDAGEECDDGNTTNGDGCDDGCSVEVLAGCGNEVVEAGEACDDGNQISGDGCTQECEIELCGDGIANNAGTEECDDGNQDDTDFCTTSCTLRECGDGILAQSEECDDGCLEGDPNLCDAQDNGDGCTQNCLDEFCGDGVDNNGDSEECDDGNQNQTDGCLNGCILPRCGDGFVQENVEECDDGNNIDADGCEADCSLPACQNNILDPGEVCFGQPEVVALVSNPSTLSAGDLDADGDLDFVIGQNLLNVNGFVQVFKNDGAGGFGLEASLQTREGPQGLALGDLNNDGALDLAVASQQDNNIRVFFNASGVLSDPFSFETTAGASSPFFVTIADLTNDNFQDIILANINAETVVALSILPPNGALGTANQLNNADTGADTRAIVVVDVDDDGAPDLVNARTGLDNLEVLINNDNFNFSDTTTTTSLLAGDDPFSIVSDDINGDNKVDVIVVNRGSSTLSVLIGDNTPSFDAQLSFRVESGLNLPHTAALGDLDGDNLSDLLVSNENSESVAAFLSRGDGTFQDAVLIPTGTGTQPRSLAVVDVDADGDLDLLIGDAGDTDQVLLIRANP